VSSPPVVAAIVQARSSSSRFPDKVLAEVEGAPLLARMLRRLLRSSECGRFAVATSTAQDDDAVAEIAAQEGVEVVRGPLEDVLERYRLAAESLDADVVVRLTGDCPLIDPVLVDRVVRCFTEQGVDYASNVHPPVFPDGLDVEVISRAALDQAACAAARPSEREHVTLYVAEHGELFSQASVGADVDRSYMRWTVDYPDDLEFVRAVFRAFRGREEEFTSDDVLQLLESDAALRRLMTAHTRNEGLATSLAAEAPDRPPAG
jgi:spore coat polysaccharide biosynthesis protein SpsF (cytidylyltransferase family)